MIKILSCIDGIQSKKEFPNEKVFGNSFVYWSRICDTIDELADESNYADFYEDGELICHYYYNIDLSSIWEEIEHDIENYEKEKYNA